MSWRISWRNLMRRKTRTIFTLLAIILGVSTMMAVTTSVATTKYITDQQLLRFVGYADLLVQGRDRYFSEELANKINQVDGIEDMVHVLHKQAIVAWHDSEAIPRENRRIRLTGIQTIDHPMVDFTLIEGSLSADGLIISQTNAILWKTNVGEKVTLQVGSEIKEISIAAIVKDTPLLEGGKKQENDPNGQWRAAIPLERLQEWYGLENQIQELRIKLLPNADVNLMQTKLSHLFQDDQVTIQPVILDQRGANPLDDLYLMFYIVGALAISLSGFILFNSLYVSVGERKREFAVMKTLGYTPGQIRTSVLTEVLILSLWGTLIGIPLGILLATGLQNALFGTFNVDFEYALQMEWALPLSIFLGILIPLFASWVPIELASRTSVINAIKEGLSSSPAKPKGWRLILGILLVLGAFLNSTFSILFLFGGVFILFPYLLAGFTRFFTPIQKKIWGYEGEIATHNITRQLSRTANMAAVLSFGIGLALFVSATLFSMGLFLEEEIRSTFGGDLHIQLENPIEQKTLKELNKIPGVTGVAPYKKIEAQWKTKKREEKRQFNIISVDPSWAKKHPMFASRNAEQETLLTLLNNKNAIILGSYAFSQWGGKVGEIIQVQINNNVHSFQVVGVADTNFDNGYVAFVQNDTITEVINSQEAYHALLSSDQSQSQHQIKHLIYQNFGEQVSAIITSEEKILRAKDTLPGLTSLFMGLLFLAILISGLGLVNTLLMNVMERIREIGVMRATGFTRGQIRKMILSEGFIVGISGACVGVLLGLITLYLNSISPSTPKDVPFIVPWVMVVLSAIIAISLSLVAALLPANRASKIPLNSALKYE